MGRWGWHVDEHVEGVDWSLRRRLHKQCGEHEQHIGPLHGVVDQSSIFAGVELHIHHQFAWCEG